MMHELLDMIDALGRWSLSILWLPLFAWTLLALPVYAALRRTDRWHPLARYRLYQALLLALPVGLGAAASIDASGLSSWLAAWITAAEEPTGLIVLPLAPTVDAATTAASDTARLTGFHALGALTGVAFLLGAVQLARLFGSSLALRHLHASNATGRNARVQRDADRLAASLGVRRAVDVRLVPGALVPMTYGLRRPTILLPHALAAQSEALRMTLTHELIHIRRFDFLSRCVEQFVAAAFAIHPGVARLARSAESAREIACDAEALRRAGCSRRAYADLLSGFAARPRQYAAFAPSIAETSSLKQRIRAMANFSRFKDRFPRYTPLLAAALIAALGLGIVACSDAVTPPGTDDASEDATAQTSSTDGEEIFVVVEDPPELIGGIEALQQAVEYPESAKEAGIEGEVFVQFTVDEDGNVTDPTVTRGVHKLLDQAAVDAVEEMEFEPGRQRGERVKVEMSLPMTFKLGDDSPSDQTDDPPPPPTSDPTESSSSGSSETTPDAPPPPPSRSADEEAEIGISPEALETSSLSGQTEAEQIQIAIRADGSVYVDGAATSIDDVADVLRARMAHSSTEWPVVSLRVANKASMGIVNDVQEQLRDAEALRINYSSKRSAS